MNVSEIYSKLAERMIGGMMFHDSMSQYYRFLGLNGYARCHEYHYCKESKGYQKLCRYFTEHHNKLIPESKVDVLEYIPSGWYMYARQDVDTGTKRQAVKDGVEKYVAWEQGTKDLYQRMYRELMEIGEVASAKFVCCFVKDVDRELKYAQKKHIKLKTADYDIGTILAEQDALHKKYKVMQSGKS